MANVLKQLKPRSEPPKPSSQHNLESAIGHADDARDIARDLLRRLPDYDADCEESTARHDPPSQHFHVTVNNGSKPDIELDGELAVGPLKITKVPKWLATFIGLAVAGLTAYLAERFAR